VLKWPDRATVDAAARQWARRQRHDHRELLRIGYFGSYARGDWGVGSDLDLLAIVSYSDRAFGERALDWELSELPLPADLLIYTADEWTRMVAEQTRFARTIESEAVWL
jgi:predicted nucleotidyltransferase